MISFNKCLAANVGYYPYLVADSTSTFCGIPMSNALKMLHNGAEDVYYSTELDGLMPVYKVNTSIPVSGVNTCR